MTLFFFIIYNIRQESAEFLPSHTPTEGGQMADTVVTSNEGYRIDIDNGSAYTDKAFQVSHDNGTELFRVQEDGNVGIGTSNPGVKLQVGGSNEGEYIRKKVGKAGKVGAAAAGGGK